LRRVVIAQNSLEIEGLRGLWEHLHAQSPGATLFQSFALNELAARMLNGGSPLVVAAESDSGAAIIPAAVSNGCITLLGESLFDYRDVLSDGDPEALSLAWSTLSEQELPLRIAGIRGDTDCPMWELLGWDAWCAAPCVRHTPNAAVDYCGAHSRLGSRLRRLQRAGAELKHYSGGEPSLVRWIYRKKAEQQTAFAPNIFAERERIDFMVAWCALAGRLCDIYCFEAGSEIVSALVTFRDSTPHPARRFYTIYFDPRWEKFSPGTVLVYEVARRSLQEGLEADFMTGEQPHKLRLAADSVPLYQVSTGAAEMRVAAEEVDQRVAA